MAEKFSSKTAFIMASVGSAVGLGNIFRFPALCVKYGIIYIIVYILLLFAVGIPLLMSEVALGRKFGGSAAKSFAAVKPKYGFIGWLAGVNSFVIMTYYCILFSFVLLCAVFSFKLAKTSPDGAAELFPKILYPGGFPFVPLLFLIAGWAAVVFCFGEAKRIGKISTVAVIFASFIIFLLALFMGFSRPNMLVSFLKIHPAVLLLPHFWRDALGQVFFSLSVMVGVMPAYGSFLPKKENLAQGCLIIALFDLAVSLAATVIYATFPNEGMSDGMLACFSVYPKVFATLFSPAVSPMIAFLFYLSVALLCLDSVFAYLKSITCCISERFFTNENRTAVFLSIVSGFFGTFMLGQKGKGFISLLDGKITPFIILTVGVLELYVFMQLSKTNSLLKEINQNAKKGFPKGFYNLSVCVFSPVLIILLILAEILF